MSSSSSQKMRLHEMTLINSSEKALSGHKPPNYSGVLKKIKDCAEPLEDTPKYHAKTVEKFLKESKAEYYEELRNEIYSALNRFETENETAVNLIKKIQSMHSDKLSSIVYIKKTSELKQDDSDFEQNALELYDRSQVFGNQLRSLSRKLSEVISLQAKLADILRLRSLIAFKLHNLAFVHQDSSNEQIQFRETFLYNLLSRDIPELLEIAID